MRIRRLAHGGANPARVTVHEARSNHDACKVNTTMGSSDQPMPFAGLPDPHIRRFYATIDDQAVAWGQMVQGVAPQTAYIGDMFTLPTFRSFEITTQTGDRL